MSPFRREFEGIVALLRESDDRYEFSQGAALDLESEPSDNVLAYLAHLDQER